MQYDWPAIFALSMIGALRMRYRCAAVISFTDTMAPLCQQKGYSLYVPIRGVGWRSHVIISIRCSCPDTSPDLFSALLMRSSNGELAFRFLEGNTWFAVQNVFIQSRGKFHTSMSVWLPVVTSVYSDMRSAICRFFWDVQYWHERGWEYGRVTKMRYQRNPPWQLHSWESLVLDFLFVAKSR